MSKKFILSNSDLEKLKNLYINDKISTLKLAPIFGASKPTLILMNKEQSLIKKRNLFNLFNFLNK